MMPVRPYACGYFKRPVTEQSGIALCSLTGPDRPDARGHEPA